ATRSFDASTAPTQTTVLKMTALAKIDHRGLLPRPTALDTPMSVVLRGFIRIAAAPVTRAPSVRRLRSILTSARFITAAAATRNKTPTTGSGWLEVYGQAMTFRTNAKAPHKRR